MCALKLLLEGLLEEEGISKGAAPVSADAAAPVGAVAGAAQPQGDGVKGTECDDSLQPPLSVAAPQQFGTGSAQSAAEEAKDAAPTAEELAKQLELLVEEKAQLAAKLVERERDAAAVKAEAESLRAQLVLAQQQLARRTPAQAPAVKVQAQQHAADAELHRRLAVLRASPMPPLPSDPLAPVPPVPAGIAAANGPALNPRQRQQHLQHFQELMGPEPEEEERSKSVPARGLVLGAVPQPPPAATGGGSLAFILPPLKGVPAGRTRSGGAGGGPLVAFPQQRRKIQ